MTQQQLDEDLRAGLALIAGGGSDRTCWRAFEHALGLFNRRTQEADRRDLQQSFVQSLLERPEVLAQLLAAPRGTLPGRVKQYLCRHAYESQAPTEAGRLRKALDDVLRRDPRIVQRRGRLFTRVRTPPSMPLSPFHPCGTRLDHDRLADGAVALLHEHGPERSRSSLARALVTAWGLDTVGEVFHEEHSVEDRLALKQALALARLVLEPRELALVVDATNQLPLRTARQRVNLSVAAAHGVRRCAGRKLAQVASELELSRDERLSLLDLLAA